ncbi:hypothetical protein EV361DRAFT_217620 [Lentinula raphanica]|uniref:F-box domain-containing protein n=1 Tax=Lentinula raphanica TaxID=153919 RepID=A0AA38UIA5_9AGAR|nr:hypothetical protein EV360DRAFT_87387 [Lentinula raphanica]KAJ3823973.1 hypothetical protein F5880DRAFT_1612408 [Lentinula raphanica]KAJ3839357.1 hypothetical protein F5878DRAFT_660354 [Lentinula raphanica]KAJ3971460.1 hypothetical protein EV361DRAFT_217620 [Lentinula raphanica]
MGFFSFLDLSQPQLKSELDISFDLTIPRTPLSNPISPITKQQCYSSRIPLEIIMMIMEAAYDEEDVESNRTLLKSLALVCIDWSFPAQRLLFRHVSLNSQAHYVSFAYATDRSTQRGRVLGDAVHTMRVSLDPNQPGHLSQLNFAEAVTHCPNLHELGIGLYGCVPPGDDIVGSPDSSRMRRPAPSFDEAAIALLRSGPSITSLRFSNWSENRQSITQLLHVWSSLKSLVISGTPPELPSPISEPSPCTLEKLRMNFQTSPSVDFMRWLLHHSGNTLRALEFEREPSTAVLHYLIHTHHATLTSLSLPSCSRATARVLDKCTALRHFSVEDAISFPVALKKLEPRVEHVGFGLNKETSMQTVLEAVKANESIQSVTVNLWNGGKLHRQLSSLQMTCALRGIHLRITNDIQVFRAIVRGAHMA